MALAIALGVFALGGVASISLVSALVDRTGLRISEDKVYDRRL